MKIEWQEYMQRIVEEKEIIEALLEIGQEKHRLIILGDVEELDKIIQKEGIMISHLEKVEGARFKFQGELAAKRGISIEELTARCMYEMLQDDYPDMATRIKNETEELGKSLEFLKNINKENNELLNMSMEYINEMRSILTGDGAGTYSARGKEIDENPSRPDVRLLDTKA